MKLYSELCQLLFAQAHKLKDDEYGLNDDIFKEVEKQFKMMTT